MKEYIYLNEFLSVLTERSGIHVCVHDISGILHRPDLKLEYKFRIHSKDFCDTVKSCRRGFDTCMRCKSLCNKKAVRDKTPFFGRCPFGLFELVYPVVISSQTAAIIYVGGVVDQRDESEKRILRSENAVELAKKLDECPEASREELMMIGRAVESYMRFILSTPPPKDDLCHRYPIFEIKVRIQSEYKKPLTLKGMSELYFFNEKYLGQLFRSETGMTFHEYLNKTRIEKARDLIESSDLSILDIAYDCGFGSVSYFNRVFKSSFGITPMEYRRIKSGETK